MVLGSVFIAAVIAGVTQFIKLVRDHNYSGALVVVIAVVVGILLGLVDTQIGVQDITVAQGVLLALAAAGIVATAEKIG